MKKDKVAPFKEAVFENLKVLDVVLRMFMTTIMVKYVGYSAKEAWYCFLNSLITMKIINWSALHCLVTVKYPVVKESKTLKTYMQRWCDSYCTKRSSQWRYFFQMLFHPCHFHTMGALSNMDPYTEPTCQEQLVPYKTIRYREERHFFGIKLHQTGPTLERVMVQTDDGPLPYNCLLDAISQWRQTVQKVAVGLKQWIEYDDEDRRYGDFRFAIDCKFVDPENHASNYLVAYQVPNDWEETVPIPVCRLPNGEIMPYPSMDSFKSAFKSIFDKVNRYQMWYYQYVSFY